MKNPKVRCQDCGEAVFGLSSNIKKPVSCQQCRFDKNSGRKFQGVKSRCVGRFYDARTQAQSIMRRGNFRGGA